MVSKEPFSFHYGFILSLFFITTLRMIMSGLRGTKCLPPPFLFSKYIDSLTEKKISRTFLYNIAFQLALKSKSLKKTRKTEERKSRAGPQLYKFAIPLPSSSDRGLPRNKESLRKLFCDPPSTMKYVPALNVSFFENYLKSPETLNVLG